MTRIAKTILATLTLLTVSAFAMQVQADTYRHIDEMALAIQKATGKLASEARHYRKSTQYRHILNDTRELKKLARHVHQIAHRRGSLDHLQADVAELDEYFHHLESVFDQAEIDAANGRGCILGNTRHVKVKLNEIEDCIHHLQADLRALRAALARQSACPSDRYRSPVARPTRTITTYGNYGGYGNSGYRNNGYRGYDYRNDRPACDGGRSSRGGVTVGRAGGFQLNWNF